MRILALLTLLILLSSAPVAAKSNGWVLEQRRALNGKVLVFTSDRGRRFDNIDCGYAVVAAAPTWNVYMCNNKKKIYCPLVEDNKIKVKSMSLNIARSTILNNADDIKWSKVRSAKFMGHPADVWRGFCDGSKIGTNGRSGAEFAYTVEYWVATDISLAPSIAKAYHQLLGWPESIHYLPVRCFKYQKSGKNEIPLETKSFKADCNNPDLFQVPKGYKLASNEMEVLTNMSNMSELLDELGGQRRTAK